MGSPEILAPAGSLESVFAAVRCGADGVYVGGKDFSARAGAVNFSRDELETAANYCHLHGVKIYRAMNTCIFDSEAEAFAEEVRISAEMGIDGLILQDMGGAAIASRVCPRMPLHASTQMTVHTPEGARFLRDMGFCRVVPARENTLAHIKDICRTGIETEVFVHGAQCMCLSGQCYMSAVIGSRSANRGRCAQSCRLPFDASGTRGRGERHDLSLKDMSLICHARELAGAGVSSFKIEGRMKRPEYVAAAVTALRHALDGTGYINEDMKRLRAVFSRSGFTDGYLTGKTGAGMFGFRSKEDVTAAADVLDGLAKLYKDEIKDGSADFSLDIRRGENSVLSFSCGEINGSVTGDIPEQARTRSLTLADAEKHLSKLGGTRYTRGVINLSAEEGLTLSAAGINDLRRRAVSALDDMSISRNAPRYETFPAPPLPEGAYTAEGINFRVMSDRYANIAGLLPLADKAALPLNECVSAEGDCKEKLIALLPALVIDEEGLIRRVCESAEAGVTRFMCGNLTHAGLLRRASEKLSRTLHIHGGTGMNITNSHALKKCGELNFEDALVSFELKAKQTAALKTGIPIGLFVYGRLPLMTVRNCPVRAARGGCKDCKDSKGCNITDRTRRVFPVKCGENYSVIYNCDILNVCDKLGDFGDISFALIDLSGESPESAEKIYNDCINGIKPQTGYTRGLYYRGII